MKILVGDLETERDADRLKEAGADALQIVTGGICHLEAQMIWQGMENLDLEGVRGRLSGYFNGNYGRG